MRKLFKKFRYGEKGFTLIELLVVVAILGVLAAVVVPNVGKFMGRGKNEAGLTELHNVGTAMMAMMADTGTANITAVAATDPANDMSAFPDGTSPLYGASGSRYLMKQTTKYWYSCEGDGTVRGWWTADGSTSGGEIGVDDAP